MPVPGVFHELGQTRIVLIALHEVIEGHAAIAVVALVEVAVDHPSQHLGSDRGISADAAEIEQPAIQMARRAGQVLVFQVPHVEEEMFEIDDGAHGPIPCGGALTVPRFDVARQRQHSTLAFGMLKIGIDLAGF